MTAAWFVCSLLTPIHTFSNHPSIHPSIIYQTYPDVPRSTEVQIGRQEQVHRRLVLQSDLDGQNLDFDESMMGKTQMQIRMENPEEKLEMSITEHEQDGVELARVVAKMVEDNEDPSHPADAEELSPFSPKLSSSSKAPPEGIDSLPPVMPSPSKKDMTNEKKTVV
jgi:hypothetical protein